MEKLITLFRCPKARHKTPSKCVRCDNAGENCSLQKAIKSEGWNAKFEFTAPGSPQQNGRVERKFATPFGNVRASFDAMGMEGKLRNQLWCEKARDSQYWDNATSRDGLTMSHKLFHGVDPPLVRNGRQFGEMGIVAFHQGKKMRSKLSPRGRVCVHLGPGEDHANDVHRFLAMDAKKVILSRDVTWLNKSYGE